MLIKFQFWGAYLEFFKIKYQPTFLSSCPIFPPGTSYFSQIDRISHDFLFVCFHSTIDLHNRTLITLFCGYLLICFLNYIMSLSQTWASYNLHIIHSKIYSNHSVLHFNFKVVSSKYCLNPLEVGIESFRTLKKKVSYIIHYVYLWMCAFTSDI